MRNLQALIADIKTWTALRIWLFMTAAIIAGPIGFVTAVYLLKKPPVVILDVREDQDPAVVDGDINVTVTKQSNADCLTSVARFLSRPDPTDPLDDDDPRKRKQFRLAWRAPFAPPAIVRDKTGAILFGELTYRLSIPLPDHIEPGWWTLLTVSVDYCGGLSIPSEPRYHEGKPFWIEPRQ